MLAVSATDRPDCTLVPRVAKAYRLVMVQVPEGRWTATLEGDFVVLLIGAKVRNPLKARKAIPLLAQMRNMLADLEKDSAAGLLSWQQHGRFGVIVQYWRSFEALEKFARDPDHRHAKVWRDWYRLGQNKNNAAGIWHETYKIRASEYEALYQGMPTTFGLMKAGTAERVGSTKDTAAKRSGVQESPLPLPVDS